jgi:thymidylate kinase
MTHAEVLKEYPRAIVHLRLQFEKHRFGVVLGAGVGRDFKVPMWRDLVARIAKDPRVNGTRLLEGEVGSKSLPYKSEMLFQLFRENTLKTADKNLSNMLQDSIVISKWLDICAEHIYSDVDPDLQAALAAHPYFNALLPLVQGSHLTINFNFDDFLERSLALNRKEDDKGTRGFETVTDPWPQFRRSNSVIYHPHGMVPDRARVMELPVDRFVFSEAAYSAQYVGSRGHDTSFLLAHFARNTCLLLGCALEEELRNVLMRGAQINPGNYHYYIHYVEDDTSGPSAAQRALIAETNFNVYNLITLFLTKPKIKALLELLNPNVTDDKRLKDEADQCEVSLKYSYYLTGALGVGKTTVANLLRNLHVLDEWQEIRPEILARPWDSLTEAERKEADDWIAGQFHAKNNALRDLESVIAIVDRPPLDPLVFAKKEDRRLKAKTLLDRICPNRKWKIEAGTVILLTGDPEVLSARVRARGRDEYSEQKLQDMQEDLLSIYQGCNVNTIDTKNLSVLEVARKVAWVVHRLEYAPCDLNWALLKHAGETV